MNQPDRIPAALLCVGPADDLPNDERQARC